MIIPDVCIVKAETVHLSLVKMWHRGLFKTKTVSIRVWKNQIQSNCAGIMNEADNVVTLSQIHSNM